MASALRASVLRASVPRSSGPWVRRARRTTSAPRGHAGRRPDLDDRAARRPHLITWPGWTPGRSATRICIFFL